MFWKGWAKELENQLVQLLCIARECLEQGRYISIANAHLFGGSPLSWQVGNSPPTPHK